MAQSLDELLGIDRRVTIRRFIGEEYPSRAKARKAMGSDDIRYVAKTNIWEQGMMLPIVAQEMLCGLLGQRIGMPIPKFRILHHQEELWFGSEFRELVSQFFQPELLARVPNRNEIHLIAAFDVWVHNLDRRPENLAVAKKGQELEVIAFDHTHCPLYGIMACTDLPDRRETLAGDIVQAHVISALTHRHLLLQAIDRITTVGDDEVTGVVFAAPGSSWSEEDRTSIASFLIERKSRLLEFFQRSRDAFSHLEGGPP